MNHFHVWLSCGPRIIKIIFFINDCTRNSEPLKDSIWMSGYPLFDLSVGWKLCMKWRCRDTLQQTRHRIYLAWWLKHSSVSPGWLHEPKQSYLLMHKNTVNSGWSKDVWKGGIKPWKLAKLSLSLKDVCKLVILWFAASKCRSQFVTHLSA